MKILRIGDPHVKNNNLADSNRLMLFSLDIARQHKVDRIEILGDLMHSHEVLHLQVIQFWTDWLTKFSNEFPTVVLVGNHDQSGDYHKDINSLRVFNKLNLSNLSIIERPTSVGLYSYMPYFHDSKSFIEEAKRQYEQGARILTCHQTFKGSKYENGFYAPDGIEVELLPFDTIISGHIHIKQRFHINNQEVIYPGTGKWDTLSDVNQPKGITLFTHDESGKIEKEEFFSTENVCEPILAFEYLEGQMAPIYPKNARVTIQMIGSSEWINKEKSQFKNVGITTKVTDKSKKMERKLSKSLEEFISSFNVVTGIDRKDLLEYMQRIEIL